MFFIAIKHYYLIVIKPQPGETSALFFHSLNFLPHDLLFINDIFETLRVVYCEKEEREEEKRETELLQWQLPSSLLKCLSIIVKHQLLSVF